MSKKLLFAGAASLTWAVFIILSKYLFIHGENPYTLAFWTTILEIPIWTGITIRNRRELPRIKTKTALLLIIIGLMTSVGIIIVENFAVKYTTAVNYSFLIRLTTVFTIFLAGIFFREKLSNKKIVLVACILLGSYFLTTNGAGIVLHRGDIFTIIEAFMLAFVNNILIKMVVAKIHPDLAGGLIFFVEIIPIILFAIMNNALKAPINWFIVLLLICVDVLNVQTRNRAYQIATASYVTMIMSFTPVLVTIISVFALGERITPIQLVGGAFIVSAGVFAEKLKI